MTDIAALAALISDDVSGKRPFRDLTPEELPDAAAAHEVQAQVVAAVYGTGEAIGGRKIAWNGAGQADALGLSEPGAAVVPAALIVKGKAELKASDYSVFCMEPEIAAVMGSALGPKDGGYAPEEVAAAIATLHPAFELLDPRGAGKVRAQSFIASNINNRGLALGGPGLPFDEVDHTAIRSTVTVNGEAVLDKVGAAPMPPLQAATFLVNHFTGRGRTIAAGEILLLGTHMPLGPVPAPAEVRFELEGLGAAEFSIT